MLINGDYGERIAAIATRLGPAFEALRWPEDQIVEVEALDRVLP